MRTDRMPKSGKSISRSFLTWLLVIVLLAFVTSIGLSWILQTKLANNSAEELLWTHIRDVQLEIQEKSDRNLLELTRRIAEELPEGPDTDPGRLKELMAQYDVSEINVIDPYGFISASTNDDFQGYDMRRGEQSLEFMCLVTGSETEFVQKFEPISYRNDIARKYAGVRFQQGGFVEVGYDAARFQKDVDLTVVGITSKRHVGRGGFIMVADMEWNLVSDLYLNEGKKLSDSGAWADPDAMPEGTLFYEKVYGVPCSCIYATTEGYHILAVIPEREIHQQRNTSVMLTSALEINVFILLFVMIFLLVRKLVVRNIKRVNDSLSRIAGGNLSEVVDVRSNTEFSSLSDDINATVDVLKQHISAEAARIDEELAYAKDIQQSALPSVFPPYPDRTDFSLYATMDTAKEVGGDFYDFYLLEDNKLAFLAADVSGKGIPAALFMMTGKTVIRDYAERGDTPAGVFRSANRKLCSGNEAETFITAWMGFLDTDTGLVRFVNAGHNPPVLIRSGRASFVPMKADLILAVMDDADYREQKLQLEPGDFLLVYTDGVTEAANEQEEMYGEERLLNLLSADYGTGEEACRKICGALKEDIDRFAGGAPQFDDITMLCLYYAGKKAERTAEISLEEATPEKTDEVVESVDRIIAAAGCPEEIRTEIDMAVEEIYINIASYAYTPGTGPALIQAAVAEDGHGVSVTFTDRGIPFNPLDLPAPDLTLGVEERPIGGLGIYMVRNTMDDVAYEYRDGQNILKITKAF